MGKEKRQQRVRSAKGRNRGHRYERPFVWWANLDRKRREIFLKDSLKIADKLRRLHPENGSRGDGFQLPNNGFCRRIPMSSVCPDMTNGKPIEPPKNSRRLSVVRRGQHVGKEVRREAQLLHSWDEGRKVGGREESADRLAGVKARLPGGSAYNRTPSSKAPGGARRLTPVSVFIVGSNLSA